jgi:hypothetical protein
MQESKFFAAVKFDESEYGWYATYEDGLSKLKWVGQGRTKYEAFDDLIELDNAPEILYNFKGLTDEQIVEYFSMLLEIAKARAEIAALRAQSKQLKRQQ